MNSLSGYKITVFGDSISKGILVTDNKPCITKNNAVSIIEKHYNIKIENNSVFGQTLSRLRQKLFVEKYLENIDKSAKNYVVFSIGGNDSDFNWTEVAKAPKLNHQPKNPISEFSRQLDESVKRLQKTGVRVLLTTLPPIDSERYLNNIAKRADKERILEFFCNDTTNINRHQECYNNEILKCALKNDCGLIDIRPAFLLNRDYLDYMCEDGIHPNEKGQEKIAQNIIDMINQNAI